MRVGHIYLLKPFRHATRSAANRCVQPGAFEVHGADYPCHVTPTCVRVRLCVSEGGSDIFAYARAAADGVSQSGVGSAGPPRGPDVMAMARRQAAEAASGSGVSTFTDLTAIPSTHPLPYGCIQGGVCRKKRGFAYDLGVLHYWRGGTLYTIRVRFVCIDLCPNRIQ